MYKKVTVPSRHSLSKTGKSLAAERILCIYSLIHQHTLNYLQFAKLAKPYNLQIFHLLFYMQVESRVQCVLALLTRKMSEILTTLAVKHMNIQASLILKLDNRQIPVIIRQKMPFYLSKYGTKRIVHRKQ